MEITFDPAKDELTKERRDISLADANRFDWTTFRYEQDTRRDYRGEERYRGFGYIGERLYMCAFTFREGTMRVISLRKANPREVNDYEQA